MTVQPLQTYSWRKTVITIDGEDWCFRFDDDNKMSYKYILSITQPQIGQLYTRNLMYCKEDNHAN